MRRPLRLALIVVGALALGWLLSAVISAYGVRDPLITTYASPAPGSVNGIALFQSQVMRRFAGEGATRLREAKLHDRDLLVHVARDSDLPDADTCTWLRDWLGKAADRQALVILRDGAVAPWLCQQWGDQAEAEAQRQDAAGDAVAARIHRDAATRLHTRARSESDQESHHSPWNQAISPGLVPVGGGTNEERTRCALFALRQVTAAPVQRLSGPWAGGGVPPSLRLRSALAAERGTTLLAADGNILALEIRAGSSRLMVVANATALLDGALVDPAARALVGTILDDLERHGASKAAWVHRLVAGGEAPPEGFAKLFARPFVWATLHALALLVAYLGWRAVWLGRRSPATGRSLERFARHIDALAAHLRERSAMRPCLEAIATALGKRIEHEPLTTIDALTIVALWHHPELTEPDKPTATLPVEQEQA